MSTVNPRRRILNTTSMGGRKVKEGCKTGRRCEGGGGGGRRKVYFSPPPAVELCIQAM